MSDAARSVTRDVRRFYERFPFPGTRAPDQDGLILLRRLRAGLRPGARVLDAGCGTGNTTVSLARFLPRARVTGVDVCARSLRLAERAARTAGCTNVRFERRDLMGRWGRGDPFDVVLCLGVLHHTQEMARALRNLVSALAADGDLYLWVYGRHGRARHALNVQLLRMLLPRGAASPGRIAAARDFAVGAQGGAPLSDLYGSGRESADWNAMVRNDAWIADQFLHVHEASLDLPEILGLLDGGGLDLREWIGIPEAPERLLGSAALGRRFLRLAPRDRLVALDLLLKPSRYFVVARRTRQGRAK